MNSPKNDHEPRSSMKMLFESYQQQKKSGKIMLIVGIVVAVLGMIIGGLNEDTTIGTIGFIASPIGVIVGVIGFVRMLIGIKNMRRIENIVCSCGYKFHYPEDVKTTVIGKNRSTTDKGKRSTFTIVKLDCTCPKCKKTKTFREDIVTKEEALNGFGIAVDSVEHPLENELQKYFDNVLYK